MHVLGPLEHLNIHVDFVQYKVNILDPVHLGCASGRLVKLLQPEKYSLHRWKTN